MAELAFGLDLVKRKKIRSALHKTLPLKQAREAHRMMVRAEVVGKLALCPGRLEMSRKQAMSWPRHVLTDLLGIKHPIIQAPMAGASTAALAAAVSNAGALGGFGGTDLSPDELREVIHAIRRETDKPFIINLYLDRTEPYVSVVEHEASLKKALAPAHAELQAGEVPDPIDVPGKFDRQIAVAIEERVPVLSSHFGAPGAAVMRRSRATVRALSRRRRPLKRRASW